MLALQKFCNVQCSSIRSIRDSQVPCKQQACTKWDGFVNLACQDSLLHAAGVPLCKRPALLLLLSDGSLLVYQAYLTASLALSFRRLPIDWPPCLVQKPPEGASDSASMLRHANAVAPSSRIARFEQLGELTFSAGIFIGGPHPAWLIASRWGCSGSAWGQVAAGVHDGLFASLQLTWPLSIAIPLSPAMEHSSYPLIAFR